MVELCADEAEIGDVDLVTDSGSCIPWSNSGTTVTGDKDSAIGESGKGWRASGISKEGTSMGVDARGEMIGSTPRPTGDVTSGDRGLGHSLSKTRVSLKCRHHTWSPTC